jgi:HPt (histidine-containing phosphotransfer) domain-containing protein
VGDLAGRPADPTNTPTDVPNPPTIDPDAIANLRELNPGDNGEFLREIVGIYIEDTPKRLADLRAALAAGDVASFTRAAHTIKGSSANVGAQVLKGIAERLEIVSRKDGLGAVSGQIADCEEEFERVKAELRKISA